MEFFAIIFEKTNIIEYIRLEPDWQIGRVRRRLDQNGFPKRKSIGNGPVQVGFKN